MKSKKILIVAGEVSGDLHGAHLVEAIHRIGPEIEFLGMGGDKLQQRGMRLLRHVNTLSVVGISEALRKLRTAFLALRELKKVMEEERPDLVILIDYPEFNLRLAKIAHKIGISVLYYISPQIWAWRPGRVKSIAKWVRKMVVFFPFEIPLYQAAGVDVDWVGHPLLDIVKPILPKEEAFCQFDLDPKRKTIALLPGSRMEEVIQLLPPMLDSAILLRKEIPELQFILPLAPGIPESALSPWINSRAIPITVTKDLVYDVMNISDFIITASGTATLEAAILGKPMVILYKVSWFSYWVGRALIRVKQIGLVNLIAGEEVAKELLQEEVHPERIMEETLRILRNPDLCKQKVEAMAKVRQSLGEPGAASRAARIVLSLLSDQKV